MKSIYIYETPDSKEIGLIKIGESSGEVRARIEAQFNTASVFEASKLEYTLLYETTAVKEDGTEFGDRDIHAVLEQKGYKKHQVVSDNIILKAKTEWYEVEVEKVIALIEQYKKGLSAEQIEIDRYQNFPMRPEQQLAVDQTISYFSKRKSDNLVEMLWNAKMRFGKTFTAYQLAKKADFSKVLVLTYKPAVEDAWKTDLESHIDFKNYVFLKRESLTRINHYLSKGTNVVAFASYQDLLGSKDEDTSIKDKHKELFSTEWDIVIIDEFHYGAGTKKAKDMLIEQANSRAEVKELVKDFYSEEDEEAEEEKETNAIIEVVEKAITSKFRLFLSGTPFRAIADSKFEREAIFNWTYTDEQKAKSKWNSENPSQTDANPYRSLPQIKMYLYQVSDDLIRAGVQEGKDEFSLNYFFKAEKKKFINEGAVRRWLDLISGRIVFTDGIEDDLGNEVEYKDSQYPFDENGTLCTELDHTLWYLNRVDSAYALKELLEGHPIFKNYHIILAAGKEMKSGVEAVQPVLQAIDNNKKTITITVGKLTTGVSIPKWKAVLFLRDTDSPENYFQTAFRAQTPYKDKISGHYKETCYIFDFSPNRSLKLLTSYSEKLTTDSQLTTSEEKISEFVRYLPVLKVQGNQMVSMDARDVLTFDLSGIDAKGLGERFVERRNIVVTRDTIDAIGSSQETLERCQAIFEKIKAFKKYTGASDKEMKDSDATVAKLDANNGKIKELETKEAKTPQELRERDKETDKAEKELKSERDKVRELLRTLLSRIPIFMYLTDATEENLEQVLVDTKLDLFRKATGITIEDFEFLRDIGLIRVDSIDGYILKFLQLENQNYEITNSI
jgi:superfamily II DNA or RNA helicase